MSDKKQRFLSIIKSIGFPLYEGIYSGQIEKICIDKTDMSLEMYISFAEFVAPNNLNELVEKLKQEFVSRNVCNKAEIFVEFLNKDVPNIVLEEYYKYFVETLSNVKVRYVCLKKFETKFDNNTVSVMVGDDFDRDIVLELLSVVEKCFEKFGLNFVKVTSEVNQFIVPISDEIKKAQEDSQKEIDYEQRKLENALNNKTEEDKTQKQRMTKMPKQGTPLNDKPMPLKDLPSSEYELVEYTQKHGVNQFVVEGDIVKAEIRTLSTGSKIYEAILTDNTSSIIIKTFINPQFAKQEDFYQKNGMPGSRLKIYGYLSYDNFSRDMVLKIKESGSLGASEKVVKKDNAPFKRVELHAHTKMSAQDSILDVKDYVRRAIEYGHKAIAVTDKYNVQGLPDLEHEVKGKGIKPIYGLEGAFVDENKFNSDAEVEFVEPPVKDETVE